MNATTVLTGILTFMGTLVVAWLGFRGKQGDQSASTQVRFYTDLVARVNQLEATLALRDQRVNELVQELADSRSRASQLAGILEASGITIPASLALKTNTPTPQEAVE